MGIIWLVWALLWLPSSASLQKAPSSLRFLHAVWRHGDRSPSLTFPTDKDNGEETWPQGFGELSTQGMTQHYQLGKYLRERYAGFLSSNYSKYEVYVRSTSYNRTIMSALANMAGMFPPAGREVWKKDLLWQPVPVHSQPRESDPVLYMEAACPAEDKLYDDLMKSPEVMKVMEDNKAFIHFLKEKTGLEDKFTKLDDLWHAYDPLNCELNHKETHKWPSWVNDTVFMEVKRLYDLSTTYYYYTPEIQQFRGGLLLGEIVRRMSQRKEKKEKELDPRMKYYAYSAHDTTVNALLSILGAYNGKNPPYASVVLVELHELPSARWEIQVWYRNGTDEEEPHQMSVSGCSKLSCPFEEFLERSQPLIPEDWAKECGLPSSLDQTSTWRVIVWCLSGLCTVFFVGLLFVSFQWWQLSRGTGDYSLSSVLTDNVDT